MRVQLRGRHDNHGLEGQHVQDLEGRGPHKEGRPGQRRVILYLPDKWLNNLTVFLFLPD